jgi:hypothetical protein
LDEVIYKEKKCRKTNIGEDQRRSKTNIKVQKYFEVKIDQVMEIC